MNFWAESISPRYVQTHDEKRLVLYLESQAFFKLAAGSFTRCVNLEVFGFIGFRGFGVRPD